jgi:hypothetical protein
MALTIEELRKARDRNSQKSGSLSVDDLKKARASNIQQTNDVPLADVPLTALKNVPSSALELGKNIITPIIKPVQTAKDIYSLGKSIVGVIQPGEQGNEETARAVGQFLANRYGSLNAIKNTFANDPVGILADVSILFTGGGSLVARTPGMIGNVGQKIKTVGQAIDPITKTGQAVGKVGGYAGKNLLGLTTGVGSEAIRTAYGAGKTGGATQKAFTDNMRGKVSGDVAREQAISALQKMKTDKTTSYKKGMKDAALDDIPINFGKVEDIVLKFDDAKSFKGVSELSLKAQNKLKNVYGLIDEWKANPDLHNAKGLDMLKRRVDAEYPTGLNVGDSGVVITNIRNKIKNEIIAQAPDYKKVMQSYEDAVKLEKELVRELSLGKNASAGTTLRKLQSVMRNNVNTNYGNRLEMIKKLDPDLLPALGGQALNTVAPRGLQGATAATVAGVGSFVDPTLLAALPFQSPRLMGELALKSGQASRVLGGAPQVAQTARIAGLLEEQIEEDARQSLLNRFGN